MGIIVHIFATVAIPVRSWEEFGWSLTLDPELSHKRIEYCIFIKNLKKWSIWVFSLICHSTFTFSNNIKRPIGHYTTISWASHFVEVTLPFIELFLINNNRSNAYVGSLSFTFVSDRFFKFFFSNGPLSF
jgi:hypothetical protein